MKASLKLWSFSLLRWCQQMLRSFIFLAAKRSTTPVLSVCLWSKLNFFLFDPLSLLSCAHNSLKCEWQLAYGKQWQLMTACPLQVIWQLMTACIIEHWPNRPSPSYFWSAPGTSGQRYVVDTYQECLLTKFERPQTPLKPVNSLSAVKVCTKVTPT